MRRSRRVLEAVLFPAWEHWVVQVPAAGDVHSIVLDVADAAEVARAAAALVLEIDPTTIQITLTEAPSSPSTRPVKSRPVKSRPVKMNGRGGRAAPTTATRRSA